MLETEVKHDPYAALRHREFLVYIIARFLFTVGVMIQSVIVGWQVYDYTKDPINLGLIGLAEAVPFMAIALFAGHLADILERKRIILIAMSLFALCGLILFIISANSSYFLTHFGIYPIYGVIFLTGVARAFLGPTLFAFMSQLVPRALYSNASTWNSTIWQTGTIIGPAIGGLVYGFSKSYSFTYALDFVIIFLCLLLFSTIKSRPAVNPNKREPILNSVGEELRFVFKNQIILGALSLDMFAVFFGGAVAMLPVFANEVLKVGPEGLGILRSAPAVGGVLMALIVAHKPPFKHAGRNLLLCIAGFGLCIIGFGLSTNFYLSLFLLALSGAFDNVSVIIRSTILQLYTPDSMRGRVASVNSIFVGSSNEIGEFESGVAAKLMGLIPSVVFGGCVTLLVVSLASKFAPKLRKLDLTQTPSSSQP